MSLSLPAYFPQRSTAFNSIHRYCFCYFTLWFFATPTAHTNLCFCCFIHSIPLSIRFLFLTRCLASFLYKLFGFLNARLSYQFPPRSLSFPLCLLASLASWISVSSVYMSVPIFIGHVQSMEMSKRSTEEHIFPIKTVTALLFQWLQAYTGMTLFNRPATSWL